MYLTLSQSVSIEMKNIRLFSGENIDHGGMQDGDERLFTLPQIQAWPNTVYNAR